MSTNYSKNYNGIFLKKYKELETLEANEPKKYQYLLSKHRNEMDTFRYMRNTLAHNLINGEDPFIVSEDVVNLISKYLEDVKKKAYSFSVKTNKIIVANYEDKLKDVLKLMGDNKYSYLPIVDKDMKVVGIVSSDAIIDIFNKKEILNVSKEDKLNKYISYFDLSNTSNGFYLFINKETDVYELEEMIERYQFTSHKCNIILISDNGNKNGRLLGLLTPWDILKNS